MTDANLTLVVDGMMLNLNDSQIVIEKRGREERALALGNDEGWTKNTTKTDLPGMPNWRHLTIDVQDFDKLHETADTFSVRPGGHASLPDIWMFGANFPIVSARLRAILEEAFPDGSYFFHCPVHERTKDAPRMTSWIELEEAVAGGPLGADAPQNYAYWVIRNKLMFPKPPGWKRPRVKLRHPMQKTMYEMAANPAVGAYMAQMPFCCFLPTDVFHQRALYERIRAAGMTGYSEARGHSINRGENTAHL